MEEGSQRGRSPAFRGNDRSAVAGRPSLYAIGGSTTVPVATNVGIVRLAPKILVDGATTLARFYSLHMLVIPGGIFTFIFIHMWLVVRLGVTSPPWSPTAAGRERPQEQAPAGAREGLIRSGDDDEVGA